VLVLLWWAVQPAASSNLGPEESETSGAQAKKFIKSPKGIGIDGASGLLLHSKLSKAARSKDEGDESEMCLISGEPESVQQGCDERLEEGVAAGGTGGKAEELTERTV
jgi:hypothetical protein